MQQNDKQYNEMTKMPIPKLILKLSIPTVIGLLVTSIYNLADAYFVAKLGTSASAAIGIVFSLMAMIQAVGFTIGMGAGSVISRLLGEKEDDTAQKVASSALALSVVSGVALSVTGLLFLQDLMVLLGAKETVLPYAIDYAGYILYAAPVMIASFVLNSLLRAEGRPYLAMIGIGAGGLLNIALDPLLIFYFGLGIKGAALATAISQSIGFILLFISFFGKKTIIRLSFRNITKKFSVYKEILTNGMPSIFRQGFASVAAVALNYVAAIEGDAAVAAMSVVGKVFMVVFGILIGLGQGYQPVAGYNYGAEDNKRVKNSYHFTLWLGVGVMTVLAVAVYAMAPWLIQQFSSDDVNVVEIGVRALRMQCIAMPFMPLGVICNMIFQAVGKSATAAFLAACRQGVFFLPFIWLFPKWFGLAGMQAAQPVADAATFIVCVPVIHRFFNQLKN